MAARKSYPKADLNVLADTVRAYRAYGSAQAAARSLGINTTTLHRRLTRAAENNLFPVDELTQTAINAAIRDVERKSKRHDLSFIQSALPSDVAPIDELLQRREREYDRKQRADEARKLIPVKVAVPGPVGIVHMGDPHVDDPGTDIRTLRRHIEIINATPGMIAANVGDLQNNWVGRLARLYAEQSTSAAESWALTEWLVCSTPWLYLIGGNHDLWSGAGDPLKWIAAHYGTQYEPWGARINLTFPNGKQVRVNARHDFAGNSMWNTAHGPAKAAQMGWRDHLLTCGHKHTSGYQLLKDPASGLLTHALRIAGYKVHDRYAKELGLPNQNITPAVVTIIDPQYADDDPRLITVINDVEEGAEFLTWKRKKTP